MKKLYLVTLLAGLGVVVPCASESLPETSTLRTKAVELFKQKQFHEASAIYARLIALEPNDLGLLKDCMWSRWSAADYDGTAEIVERILSAHPNDVETLNMKGRLQLHAGLREEAFETYRKSLALQPRQDQIKRTLGNLFVDYREFDDAVEQFQGILRRHLERIDVIPQLGKALLYRWRFDEAAKYLKRAVALYPDSGEFQYHYGRALYYSGHVKEGLDVLASIPSTDEVFYWRGVDFLVDDALAINDTDRAKELLETHLTALRPEDTVRLAKLATIYSNQEKKQKMFEVLDRGLRLTPGNQTLLLYKADELTGLRRFSEAEELYKRTLTVSPWSIRAYRGLAEVRSSQGDYSMALEFIRQARHYDVTNPYLILDESEYLYALGRQAESRTLLTTFLASNPKTEVPVLLYHGLTPFERDPILAYSVHVTTSSFEDHIRALHTAGFTPITPDQLAAWYSDGHALPDNPLLLSFDDARLDSLVYADPVLERYNFKATMFAPLVNVEGTHPPAFAHWRQLRHFQKTGRWDIQAHGDYGHQYVTTDADGRKGLFLVNKKWIESEKRLETTEEYRARLDGDYQSSSRKIVENIGTRPVAFAFPEGAYGQTDAYSNAPEAAASNLELMAKTFSLAFVQDHYGYNLRSRDPRRLSRVEPSNKWSGEELVKRLRNHTPLVHIYEKLLTRAAWDDRPREAYQWLASMKDHKVTEPVLLAYEARIHSAVGDPAGAIELAQRSLALESSPDTEQFITDNQKKLRPQIRPFGEYEEDSQGRRMWNVGQEFTLAPMGAWNIGLGYRHSHYHEKQVDDISDDVAFVDVNRSLGLYHVLGVEAAGHFLSTVEDTYSLLGKWDARWSDSINSRVTGGRDLYETASALQSNIRAHYVDAFVTVRPNADWSFSPRGRWTDISDGNSRTTAEFSLDRSLGILTGLRAVYRFYYDDTEHVSPNYYSPQEAIANQLGLQYTRKLMNRLDVQARYLPGVGHEVGTSSEFIQDAEASVRLNLSEATSLEPIFGYTKTPTYRRNDYRLQLVHRF